MPFFWQENDSILFNSIQILVETAIKHEALSLHEAYKSGGKLSAVDGKRMG